MSEHISNPPKFRKGDLAGRVFTRLTVITFAGRDRRGKLVWECRCECGKTVIVRRDHLTSGNHRSCGCLARELFVARITTHGATGGRSGKRTPEYIAWNAMIQRCTNPSNPGWVNYGGRGITVCERWWSYENFIADMGDRPGRGYELERKDNSKGYSFENCEWATRKTQARNTRRNVLLTLDGVTMCVADWSTQSGIPYKAIEKRLAMGWSVEDALTKPVSYQHTPQSRAKIGAAFRGKKLSHEHREKLKAAWVLRRERAKQHG